MTIMMENQWKNPLLLLNCIIYFAGDSGLPLVTRLYFLHGGNNIWLSSLLQGAGFPILLIILVATAIRRRFRCKDSNPKLFLMERSLFIQCAFLGINYGGQSFFFSYGNSKLPVSTSTLILSTQLVFISFFSFLIVKQRFNAYSITAILLLTAGGGLLALNAGDDMPEGESSKEYIMGFLAILGTAILLGIYMPMVELAMDSAKQVVTYSLVMEMNLVICISASLFSCLGMLINNDFKAILVEARGFEFGEVKYFAILVSIAIATQCYSIGCTGITFCSSSLFFGITNATLVPIVEIMGVLLYKETFHLEKIAALLFAVLGFASYFYGEMQESKKKDQTSECDDSSPLIQDV